MPDLDCGKNVSDNCLNAATLRSYYALVGAGVDYRLLGRMMACNWCTCHVRTIAMTSKMFCLQFEGLNGSENGLRKA